MNLWNRIIVVDDCWVWQGSKDKDGYGYITVARKTYKTHRLAYQLTSLEPLLHLKVCHTCDNPSCINPSHLYAGTQSDNEQDKRARGRNVNANKTHCLRGHAYLASNTRLDPRGQRVCKQCDAIRSRRYRNGSYYESRP